MKNSGTYDIDSTLIALQAEIERKKMQVQNARPSAAGSSIVSNLFSEMLNKTGGSYPQLNNALEHGVDFAREFLKNTQQSIQERPWEVLRKVAVSSFAIGLFLSLRRKRSPTGEKE